MLITQLETSNKTSEAMRTEKKVKKIKELKHSVRMRKRRGQKVSSSTA